MSARGTARAAAALLALLAGAASALELNSASQAELESLKGVGTQLSARLLQARAERPFADWSDLRRRVPGIGAATAQRLSDAGLTVAGRPYAAAAKGGASAP